MIPDSHKDLLTEPVVGTITTVMPDGQPQASVIWFDFDGEYISFSTTRGRQKEKNLKNNPKATLLVIDPENPYRYIEVRGTTSEITEDNAVALIDKLAKRYRGKDKYYGDVAPADLAHQETRVIVKIKPEKVNAIG